MQQWKDVPGYEGFYQASLCGKIKSLKSGKELKLGLHEDGHMKVSVSVHNKSRTFGVHQLIAMTFLNHIPDGNKFVVDHINNNPLDNRVENLRIITNRENIVRSMSLKRDLPTGVHRSKNKFRARIRINGKLKCLGSFYTPEEASEVYKKSLNRL
jgi:hypothetical protein